MTFDHEHVAVASGARSGVTIIVAIHSTALGRAVGGCRLWRYPDWRAGLEEALLLSEAMTLKAALAELSVGGGKAVIAHDAGDDLSTGRRRDALLDLGDIVESFGGRFGVAEDVGTTADDLLIVRERTSFAYCLPVASGGTGDPSQATAHGVRVSLNVLARRMFGTPSLTGRSVTLVGLGHVGARLAHLLTVDGAVLTVTDIDDAKREIADRVGAAWVSPDEAYTTECDVLVPAALGGVLSNGVVEQLRCSAICGPANNQLATRDVADALLAREIIWAPDFLVNAGGVIHGVMTEFEGKSSVDVTGRVERIADTLTAVLNDAAREGLSPLDAAERIARDRVAKGAAAI